MIQVDKDASGGQRGVPEILNLVETGAIGYVGGTECSNDAFGGSICPELASTREKWMVLIIREDRAASMVHNDFKQQWETIRSILSRRLGPTGALFELHLESLLPVLFLGVKGQTVQSNQDGRSESADGPRNFRALKRAAHEWWMEKHP